MGKNSAYAIGILGIYFYLSAFGIALEYYDEHDKKAIQKALCCSEMDR